MTPNETIAAGKLMIEYGESVIAGKPIDIEFNEGSHVEPRWHVISNIHWNFDSELQYRRKPTPRRVPLGPEDVPPGSTIQCPTWPAWKWDYVRPLKDEACFCESYGAILFQTMMHDGWLINRNDGKGWVPCYKTEE